VLPRSRRYPPRAPRLASRSRRLQRNRPSPFSPIRLAGLGSVDRIYWAPGGQTALILAARGYFRLRPDTLELHAAFIRGSVVGWAGPDTALVTHWVATKAAVGEYDLLSGEWRPVAWVPAQIELCQSDSHWTWVDVVMVRQGGAACREIGPVYRTPAQRPAAGRVEDLQTLTDKFALPEVSPDGRSLAIGHRDPEGTAGAISTLSADEFVPGRRLDPARVSTGWMGDTLLTRAFWPYAERDKRPVFRDDGAEVGEWLALYEDGGLEPGRQSTA
jgi:hypothetical protein